MLHIWTSLFTYLLNDSGICYQQLRQNLLHDDYSLLKIFSRSANWRRFWNFDLCSSVFFEQILSVCEQIVMNYSVTKESDKSFIIVLFFKDSINVTELISIVTLANICTLSAAIFLTPVTSHKNSGCPWQKLRTLTNHRYLLNYLFSQ
jgi:hypothetical protein